MMERREFDALIQGKDRVVKGWSATNERCDKIPMDANYPFATGIHRRIEKRLSFFLARNLKFDIDEYRRSVQPCSSWDWIVEAKGVPLHLSFAKQWSKEVSKEDGRWACDEHDSAKKTTWKFERERNTWTIEMYDAKRCVDMRLSFFGWLMEQSSDLSWCCW